MSKVKYKFNTKSLAYEKVEIGFWNRIGRAIILLFTIFGTAISIFAFFQVKKTLIEYEILANTNVLDINADISKLDITYAGTSLKSKNENLRIFNLRIKNNGTETVLKNFYDSNDPLGLTIKNGKIIETPELISSSNDYLKSNLHIKFDSTGKVFFNEVILEPNQYFTIKLLVLHPANEIPNIVSFGKIAGQNEVPIISLLQQSKGSKSFIEDAFSGGIYIQLVRAFSYALILIILIAGAVYFSNKISDYNSKRKRIRIVANFKQSKSYVYSHNDVAIFSSFIRGNFNFQDYLYKLSDESELNESYRILTEKIKMGKPSSEKGNFLDKNLFGNYEWELGIIKKMIRDGYLINENEKLIINSGMKFTLSQLFQYLKEVKFDITSNGRYL